MGIRSERRGAGAALASLTVLLLGAGCSGGSHGGDSGAHNGATAAASGSASPGTGTGTGTGGQHSPADVAFAQQMIPHHQQAVSMAAMAEAKASAADVKALAAKIKQAQAPEIETLTGWLTAWGAPLPGASATPGGHDMPGMPGEMPGMMTAGEMAGLQGATGTNFDRMFLELMIRHHEGAVQMATVEQQQGQFPAAKELAAKIRADQTAEITQMRKLLGE